MVWRKQSVWYSTRCWFLVLGFGFLFPDKYSFVICGLLLVVFWCFTKGYALWNSESFWLADEIELIVPIIMLLCVVCLHRQSPARMGRLGRGGSLSCGLLPVLSLWISEKQDLHAALQTSVLHFLWLVTNHIRLEDPWPGLSLGSELGSPSGAVPLHPTHTALLPPGSSQLNSLPGLTWVRAGKGIFCADFFKSGSAFMVSWVSLPQFE